MKAYLDSSILVSLFTNDTMTIRTEHFVSLDNLVLLVSDFTSAEVVFVISRRVRTHELTKAEAKNIFHRFDSGKTKRALYVETQTAYMAAAKVFVRQLNLTLFAPDALQIVIAQRAGASLATFDSTMAASAKNLGLDLVTA